MKNILYLTVCGLLASVLLFGCGQKNAKSETSTPIIEEIQNPIIEVKVVKDSIDILIEQRAEQEFNSTIFGGLRFGSSKQAVENVWRNAKNRTVRVPYEDRVASVTFQEYDALYYHGKLAMLVLYANEGELYDALGIVYSTKYGKTKYRDWRYSNCEITVKQKMRREHDPHKDAGYGHLDSHRMYYQSYKGQKTYHLTKEPYFIEVSYINYDYLNLIEREQFVKDSIDRVQIRKEAQREAEMARKLATELATGI